MPAHAAARARLLPVAPASRDQSRRLTEGAPASVWEARREIRKLPRERQREIVRAIREGRAVSDPRDAALTAAWASALDERRSRWPPWGLPRERPRGWRAGLWLFHPCLILVGAALVCRFAWARLPGFWHWLVIAWVAYTLATMPFTFRRMLRTYWNAGRAAKENRALSTNLPQLRSTGPQR